MKSLEAGTVEDCKRVKRQPRLFEQISIDHEPNCRFGMYHQHRRDICVRFSIKSAYNSNQVIDFCFDFVPAWKLIRQRNAQLVVTVRLSKFSIILDWF